MDKLIELIDEKRNVKASTLRAYKATIKKLTKDATDKEFKNVDFLKKFTKIKKLLEEKKLSTRKNYIATILVMLRAYDDKYEKLIEKYTDYLNDISDKYNSEQDKQTKSIKEKENWVDMSELKTKVLKYYMKKIRANGINRKSKKVLSKKEKRILKSYLVASLYLLDPNNHPPRRNIYATLKIIKAEDYNKLTDKEKKEHNWLWLKSRNNKKFIFNQQKNKTENEIKLSPAINSVVNLYLKYHDSDDFLLDSKNKQMSSNSLTKFLTSMFKQAIGKKISSTMLRKIYVSSKFDLPALKEMKDTAKKMGNTVPIQMKHYYKSDKEEKKDK